MELLIKQVRRVQRRLMLEQFLGLALWCWFTAFAVAALAIGASKIWRLSEDDSLWAAAWIGGSVLLATLVAAIIIYWRHNTRLDAALEIDHRFGLKERISSSLALSPAELESAAGQALVEDAARRVAQIVVSERFQLRPSRKALLPLLPAALAFGLALFVSGPAVENPASASSTRPIAVEIEKPAQALEKKLAEQRKEAEEKGLEDAELLKKIEQGTREVKKTSDKKQALSKLNDLAKELEKRRAELGDENKLKQQLNQLKDLEKGPADRLAQAMKNADFDKAVEELNKLKDELAKNDMNQQDKEQLAKQLDEMQKRLEKMAEAHREAKKEVEKQLERAKQQGNQAQAEKLQEQLNKLQQQRNQMDKVSQMASKLGQCSKCMKNGDSKAAQQALAQLGDSLKEMQKADEEMQMLDSTLSEISECKNTMNCKECNGAGCKACQGKGKSNKIGRKDDARGRGQASGRRPEKETDTKVYDSPGRQHVGAGAAVSAGFTEGVNPKGQVQEEIKAQFESATRAEADPLSGQPLPRDYREHAKGYFDSLRESQK